LWHDNQLRWRDQRTCSNICASNDLINFSPLLLQNPQGKEISPDPYMDLEADVKHIATVLCTASASAKKASLKGRLYERSLQDEEEEEDEEEVSDEIAYPLFKLCKHKSRGGRSSLPTKYVGVWRLRCGRFKAAIYGGRPGARRRFCLGIFDTIMEAAMCYDRAARAVMGKDALANFPPSEEEQEGHDGGRLLAARGGAGLEDLFQTDR
jgi:hypothetical protein